MIKKSFTINPSRTKEEIASYENLFIMNIYQGVEVFYPYSREETFINEYKSACYELINKYNLDVVLHLPHGKENSLLENEHLDNAIRIMKDAMDFGCYLRAKRLTLHLGRVNKKKNRDDYLPVICEIVKDLAIYASKYNMDLMIENMPFDCEYGFSPKELRNIFDYVNMDNLKFIFDIGHANCSRYSIDMYLDLLKDKLCHLHLSDNSSIRDDHGRIGSGNVDYHHFLKKLKEINYDKLYTMEVLFNTIDDLLMYAKDLDKVINEVNNEY